MGAVFVFDFNFLIADHVLLSLVRARTMGPLRFSVVIVVWGRQRSSLDLFRVGGHKYYDCPESIISSNF